MNQELGIRNQELGIDRSKWLAYFGFFFAVFLILNSCFLIPSVVSAEDDDGIQGPPQTYREPIAGYNLSVGLPEIGDIKPGKDLGSFLTYLFRLSFIFAGLAAFVALFAGGIMYMVSGAVDQTGKAKEMIQGALAGVLILVCTVLILGTINPNLVNPKIPVLPTIKSIGNATPGSITDGGTCSSGNDCKSGFCDVNIGGSVCAGGVGAACSSSGKQCGPKLVCAAGNVCKVNFDETCSANSDCRPTGGYGGGVCCSKDTKKCLRGFYDDQCL